MVGKVFNANEINSDPFTEAALQIFTKDENISRSEYFRQASSDVANKLNFEDTTSSFSLPNKTINKSRNVCAPRKACLTLYDASSK
jgi:hypothetical protein